MPFEEINLNPTLEECFFFWNEFIAQWLKKGIFNYEGRRNFNIDLNSVEYMPEPWWGWNGEGDLYSVVLNYHPGTGDIPQNRESIINIFEGSKSYQDAMGKNLKNYLAILQKNMNYRSTDDWHLKERAIPMANLIGKNPKDSSHHLSIEFCPFHSGNIKNVVSFISDYQEIVLTYILGFAVQASIQINGRLKNKVFVRVSEDNFHRYLKILGFQKISERNSFSGNNMLIYKVSPQSSFVSEGYGNLNSYNLSPWPNIEFIRVTGSHNHFPTEIKPIN